MLHQAYLNGYDAEAIHQRAAEVIDHGKRLSPEALERYRKHFDEKCATSKTTIDEAKQFIPGGVQHNLALNHPFPLNIVKADGPYLYDIDGNRYIDLLNGGGVTILGNNYPPIREAVVRTLNDTGYLTGLTIGDVTYNGTVTGDVTKDTGVLTIKNLPASVLTGSDVNKSVLVTCNIQMDLQVLGEINTSARMCIWNQK